MRHGGKFARTVAAGILCIILLSGMAQAQKQKVACIGNSITCCYGIPDSLRNLLVRNGYNDTVQNEAVSGTTMLKAAYSNYSYWTYGQWAQLFQYKPNVITIMLGTNDAKGTAPGSSCVNNWINKAYYSPAYNNMIDTIYTTLGYKPRIFCVFPPPIATNNTLCVSDTAFTKEMIPMIQQVAASRGLPVINCHITNYSSVDGCHPTAVGADSLAHVLYRGLTTMRMVAFPASLNVTAKRGQTDTAGTTVLDTISNGAITGTLDSIFVTHQSSWLRCAAVAASLNAQKVINTVVLSSLPAAAGTYYDTVTVLSFNASPTSIKYPVTLTLQPGANTISNFYASPGFIADIRALRSHEVVVALGSPGDFGISVMTTDGRVVASMSAHGKGLYTLRTPAGSIGMYIVSVRSPDGKIAAAKRIMNITE